MKFIYNLGILIFNALAYFAAPFSSKAKLWVNGRKNWPGKIAKAQPAGSTTCWIHCASLGEFEQGRPVIEELKKQGIRIVLTFFSPSGYEIRKNYQHADIICYLPSDTPGNAVKFVDLVKPDFVIIVKYEFWHNYISEVHRRNIPLYLISGIFRPSQHFFKWYGSFFTGILKKFTAMFVQDKQSYDLLAGAGIDNVYVTGDTRFDRVVQIAGTARDIPVLEKFRAGEKLFLAGSSWQQDEEIFAQYINRYPDRMKWVFAPHEIDPSNIDRLERLFKVKTVRFSRFGEKDSDSRILIMDNIGMLSSAYKYAYIAGIGGGFGKGIHNILEAACWGVPVMFGPRHKKFMEAVNLLKLKGAMTFSSYDEFSSNIEKWLSDEDFYSESSKAAVDFVKNNAGATEKILKKIAGQNFILQG